MLLDRLVLFVVRGRYLNVIFNVRDYTLLRLKRGKLYVIKRKHYVYFRVSDFYKTSHVSRSVGVQMCYYKCKWGDGEKKLLGLLDDKVLLFF